MTDRQGVYDYLLAIRQRLPKLLKQRLDRAVAEGDLPPGLDTSGIAAFYATVSHGLSVRAGDGVSQRALMAAVEGALASWETLTSTAETRGAAPAPPGSASPTGGRSPASRTAARP